MCGAMFDNNKIATQTGGDKIVPKGYNPLPAEQQKYLNRSYDNQRRRWRLNKKVDSTNSPLVDENPSVSENNSTSLLQEI